MEKILQQILSVQTEILAELRALRQAMTADVAARPAEPPAPLVEAARPDAQPPLSEPEPAGFEVEPAPPPFRPRGMMTMDELADLGGQFLDADPRPKSRIKPTDVSDLGGSLLGEIKAKNRAKRDAFTEFDRLRRDR
jgi:hypothetical protein